MTAKFLDLFGEILMKNVRDEAIEQWEMTIQGKMKSEESQSVHNLISLSGQSELINDLVPKIVDTTIHHLLWTLEQEEAIDITINNGNKPVSIKEMSDGLAGELYTEDGWINRFSNKAKS
ncbi:MULTISPECIES: epimerase [unclassified Mesobacillus]|uniref:epimerase n=1 Tax=unclassified Mesobacillus TaxID=2675270 RepID=UPI00204203BE|nr:MULTISPECIES: epimerase [unclassified Mesobacillus]MCM3125997.1 epimerase [Mesobacillus sp. MER 33]MCM3235983.1 epimerase [Mesobacillus sp. MER 48]